MKIVNNNIPNINIKNRDKTPITKPINGLTGDVFEKTKVSFGVNDPFDDFLNTFLFPEMFEDELSEIIDKAVDMLLMNDEEFEEEFMKLFLEEQVQREQDVSMYIDALSDKSVSRMILNRRKDKLDVMNKIVLSDLGFPVDIDYLNELLFSSGIKSIFALDAFVRTYNQSPQTKNVFRDLGIEAVKIYGTLNNKDDLSKFPELLLHIFIQEELSDEPNYERLNETTAFLKQIGLTNFKDFDSRYEYLADDFNGFASIQDKLDAIEYLQQTYDSKIKLLSEVIEGVPDLNKLDVKKVYANIYQVVDCLYEKNKQKSLTPLETIVEIANQSGKFKQTALRNIGDFCNGLKTTEDKIEFYKFLRDCNVSVSDFNAIASRSPISDRDVVGALINKEEISSLIAKNKNMNIASAKETYKKFSGEFCVAYKNGEVPTLLKVMDDFSIKNAESMLSFYNRVNGKNVNSISSEEFLEFIRLFKYSDSKNLFAIAKNQKVFPVEILKNEKEKFLSFEREIEKFLSEDETGYFVGKTGFDIYSEYRDLLPDNVEDVPVLLQNIRDFNIANSEEYKQKADLIKPFAKYFSSKSEMIKFVSQAGIQLDSSVEDEQHIKNSLLVLDLLFDKNNIEKSKVRIKQITDSGFLAKSKMALPQLIDSIKNEKDLRAFMEMIADKKIASLSVLGRYMMDYDSTDGSVENLFHHLYSMPEGIDFESYIRVLQHVRDGLENLNLPSCINNDNIKGVDVERFLSLPVITQIDAGEILNGLYPSENGGNFISELPNAMVDKVHFFSRFKIAEEIVNKLSASNESYQNLISKLEIDRDTVLDRRYSHYSVVTAVAKKLPKEFVNFVNSEDWLKYDETSENIPNLSLHSRMRLIDRFGFQEDDLYSEKTKQRLRNILKTVYTQTPYGTKGTDYTKRIITDIVFEDTDIETVFSKNGEMITIVPRHYEY